MLEKIKKTLNDIKNAIVERGVTIDPCDSPSTYASKILAINNNGIAMAFIPVFKVSDSKPARPTTTMSALNPTNYPDGWGEPDNLSGNIWMSYTLVGNSYVYIPWTDPILINGEYTAPVSRTFTIFGQLSNLDLNPSVPVGGTWDVANNRLVGDITSSLSNGNTLTWSAENKRISGQYTYVSNGTFSSETEKGSWSVPYCINEVRSGADGVGIRTTIAYYRGSINATGETAPDKSVNPEDRGWTTDATEIELSTNMPYLWKFTRIVYTDDSVWQDSPYVVRMYVDVGYQEVVDTVVPQLIEQLSDLQVQLNEVKETDALIKTDSENGLIALLTSYKEDVDSGTQTSFADVVANAADATIKQSVGSALGANITGVEATLDGINGYLQNLVTAIYGADGSVGSAIQQIRADTIEQSVEAGKFYWQRQIHYPESEIINPDAEGYWEDDTETREGLGGPTRPYLITDASSDPMGDNKPNPESGVVDGMNYRWVKTITVDKLSAIKQEADSIKLMVGDDRDALASIVVTAINDNQGEIQLNADTIRLNGEAIASALQVSDLIVGVPKIDPDTREQEIDPDTGEKKWVDDKFTKISPEGFVSTNANITGEITANSGTIGGWQINPTSLVSSGSSGSVSLTTSGDYAIWAGTSTNPANAEFSIKYDGTVKASNIDLAGGRITGQLSFGQYGGILTESYGSDGGISITGSEITALNGSTHERVHISSSGIEVKELTTLPHSYDPYTLYISKDEISKRTGGAAYDYAVWSNISNTKIEMLPSLPSDPGSSIYLITEGTDKGVWYGSTKIA